ncbi:MAG: hypothetical protein J6O71_02690 [Lachnospiraceae bacterium]|nr:hypothetical protein [Lachnospiraceae bacterium]
MTVKLSVSYVADLIAVILMIIQLIRLRKLSGERDSIKSYFQRFSWVVLAMSVLHLMTDYANLQLDSQLGGLTTESYLSLFETGDTLWIWTELGSYILDIFLSTVFLYMWVYFLGMSLFEDRDFIKRKFWAGFTPLIISAAVTCISIPMAVTSDAGFIFCVVAICLFFIIRIYYFMISLWMLRTYKKQNGYLRFFNPWVFFIPVFAGWLLQDIFYWGFSALGSTLGIMLIYASIVNEEKYMDVETGFYNMDFADYLKGLVNRNKYAPGSAMTFTLNSPGEMQKFSEMLRKQLPKNCEPILHSDSEVVVLTSVQERGPLVMVMEDVKAVSEVNTACCLKKKTETAVEFMERVL